MTLFYQQYKSQISQINQLKQPMHVTNYTTLLLLGLLLELLVVLAEGLEKVPKHHKIIYLEFLPKKLKYSIVIFEA